MLRETPHPQRPQHDGQRDSQWRGIRRRGRRFTPRAFVAMASLPLLGMIGVTHTASADTYMYGCVLDGAQVTTPTGSPAIGGGQFVIDTDANTVQYRIAFTGLAAAETGAHIHGPASPGTNGAVLHPFSVGNPKTGTWNYAEAEEGDILAGKTYVNIHSAAFPGGEVRGQITPLNASLDGAQEVPPVATPGRGWGVFQIDTVAKELHYFIWVDGLTGAETGAHIHGPALHGVNGGVAEPLPAGSPKVGTWTYDVSEEEGIVSGHYYVNIHTTPFPSGEVRGQIVPTVIPIDGRQEVPPVASPGAGLALLSIDRTGDALSYDVRFANLSGAETMAHIHGFAPPGSNAGVLEALSLGNRKLGTWLYGAANEAPLLDGRTYFNIHTTVEPSGEIRGQIVGLPGDVPSDVSVGMEPMARALSLTRMTPNPLAGRGAIQFRLDEPQVVRIEFFDAEGRRVRDLGQRQFGAGPHTVAWDGRDDAGRQVGSGVYHYVLRTETARVSRPVSLVR